MSVTRSLKDAPLRTYIATGPYNTEFFKYTVTKDANYQDVGTLTLVTSDVGACPVGSILQESGRKLYPGANPGVSTYMVAVYDNATMLKGFIDPNAYCFAVYNSDKPLSMANGVDPVGSVTDKGSSVVTNGPVIGGFVPVTVYNTGLAQVIYDNGSGNHNADVFLNPFLGNVFYINLTSGVAPSPSPTNYGFSQLTATINLYMRDPLYPNATLTPLPGMQFTLIVTNSNGSSTVLLNDGGNLKMPSNLTLTTAKTTTITFVTDGTYAWEVSRVAAI